MALMDCWNCLIGEEGIDCGCLVVYCEVGELTHILKANSAELYGGTCP